MGGSSSFLASLKSPPSASAALVVAEAVSRAGLDPENIHEVILGNADGAGEENRNVARTAALLAGLPRHFSGFTDAAIVC